eukprot:COSAG02_NODE_1545_length_11996_cov_6.889636_9_plen_359_part_00
MFNVIEDSAAESVARLRSRVASGLTIDWLELGNENYGIAQSCGHINPNNTSPPLASDYINFTSDVVSALGFAGIPLAAPLDARESWVGGWNDDLITATTESGAPLFDGFVMHPYTRVDAPFTPATVAQVLQSSGVMRKKLSHYVNRTNSLQVGKVRPVLLTEYGILGTDTGTFIQSLGQASMFLGIVAAVYEEGINIVQAGLHILFGGATSASVMFSFDPSHGQIVATPNGVIYKKLVSLMTGSTVLSSTVQGPSLPPGIPAVDVQALRGSDGKLRLLIVRTPYVSVSLTVLYTQNLRIRCGMLGAGEQAGSRSNYPQHSRRLAPCSLYLSGVHTGPVELFDLATERSGGPVDQRARC